MPNIRGAEKAMRSSAKKHMRNKSAKSALKTVITKEEKLVAAANLEVATTTMAEVASALDKAAQKDIIHRNRAARKKSRMMKMLNKAQAAAKAAAAAPEATAPQAKKRTTRRAQPKA